MNKPAKKTAIQFSESEIDKLIADVDATLTKAEALAKSALKKDDQPPKDDDQQAPPDASAAPAPTADAPPADAAPAAPAGAAPTDAPPADGQPQGDGALQQEGQQDAPLSDEELQEVYSSMPPEELERHYGVIRQILQSAYASQAPAPAAPGQEAQPPAAPAAAAPAPEAPSQEEPSFGKSEEMSALRKQVEDQGKALETVTKMFEILAKPQRKSVTDIQFISKSDIDPANQAKELSKDDISAWVKKTGSGSLNKSERESISNYFLTGSGKKEVEKIINSKGETK